MLYWKETYFILDKARVLFSLSHLSQNTVLCKQIMFVHIHGQQRQIEARHCILSVDVIWCDVAFGSVCGFSPGTNWLYYMCSVAKQSWKRDSRAVLTSCHINTQFIKNKGVYKEKKTHPWTCMIKSEVGTYWGSCLLKQCWILAVPYHKLPL